MNKQELDVKITTIDASEEVKHKSRFGFLPVCQYIGEIQEGEIGGIFKIGRKVGFECGLFVTDAVMIERIIVI